VRPRLRLGARPKRHGDDGTTIPDPVTTLAAAIDRLKATNARQARELENLRLLHRDVRVICGTARNLADSDHEIVAAGDSLDLLADRLQQALTDCSQRWLED
jgi:hypothetical protein